MAFNPMQQQQSPDMLMAMMTDPRATPQQRMAAMAALNAMRGGANAPQQIGDMDPAEMGARRQEMMGQGPEEQPEIAQPQAAPEAPQNPSTEALMSGAADASRVAEMAHGGAVKGYAGSGAVRKKFSEAFDSYKSPPILTAQEYFQQKSGFNPNTLITQLVEAAQPKYVPVPLHYAGQQDEVPDNELSNQSSYQPSAELTALRKRIEERRANLVPEPEAQLAPPGEADPSGLYADIRKRLADSENVDTSKDKYMALLQASLGTMAAASQPGASFLGSIGQGGLLGVKQLQEAKAARAERDMKNLSLRGTLAQHEASLSQARQKQIEDFDLKQQGMREKTEAGIRDDENALLQSTKHEDLMRFLGEGRLGEARENRLSRQGAANEKNRVTRMTQTPIFDPKEYPGMSDKEARENYEGKLQEGVYAGTVDSGTFETAKAIADGREVPPILTRGGAIPAAVSMAQALNPQLDRNAMEAQRAAILSLRDTKSPTSIGSKTIQMNTLLGHLGKAYDSVKELNNEERNAITQWARQTKVKIFPSTDIRLAEAANNFKIESQLAAGELNKIVAGSSPADRAAQELESSFSVFAADPVNKGAIKTMAGLGWQKIQSSINGYNRAVTDRAKLTPWSQLDPDAQRFLRTVDPKLAQKYEEGYKDWEDTGAPVDKPVAQIKVKNPKTGEVLSISLEDLKNAQADGYEQVQ
jgi:hypothetical protein